MLIGDGEAIAIHIMPDGDTCRKLLSLVAKNQGVLMLPADFPSISLSTMTTVYDARVARVVYLCFCHPLGALRNETTTMRCHAPIFVLYCDLLSAKQPSCKMHNMHRRFKQDHQQQQRQQQPQRRKQERAKQRQGRPRRRYELQPQPKPREQAQPQQHPSHPT